MSRHIRTLLTLLVVSSALVASACVDATGPQPVTVPCDYTNGNICMSADYSNGNI
jgi:hypothetical protein